MNDIDVSRLIEYLFRIALALEDLATEQHKTNSTLAAIVRRLPPPNLKDDGE